MVVNNRMDKKSATETIRRQAKDFVPVNDQMRFLEVMETELMNLHEGNISRYGVRLAEYEKWHKNWK